MRSNGAPVSALLMIALAITACSPGTSASPAAAQSDSGASVSSTPAQVVELTFRQAWLPDQLYVPFLAALDEGYYAAEGIKFINQVGSGAGTSTKVVGAGSVPIGKGAAAVVVQAIAQGVPITIIMTEHQTDPTGVCSLQDSGITTGEDLEGKSIATSAGDAGQQEITAAMQNAGLDADSVNWVLIDPAQWVAALLAKQVDAIGCDLSSQPVDLAAQGVEVNTVSVADMGLAVPSQVVFVNNTYLSEHRDVVAAFLRATLQGYKFAFANPGEAAQAVATYYPEVDAQVLEQKWERQVPFLFSDATTANGFGWSDQAAFQNLVDILTEGGQLTTELDLGLALDNSLLEDIPTADRQISQP